MLKNTILFNTFQLFFHSGYYVGYYKASFIWVLFKKNLIVLRCLQNVHSLSFYDSWMYMLNIVECSMKLQQCDFHFLSVNHNSLCSVISSFTVSTEISIWKETKIIALFSSICNLKMKVVIQEFINDICWL